MAEEKNKKCILCRKGGSIVRNYGPVYDERYFCNVCANVLGLK